MVDLVIKKKAIDKKKNGFWSQLVGHSGVYIFTNKDSVLYVGRSKNLYQRILSHYSRRGICSAFKWDCIHFIFCENHMEIEKYVIAKLHPIKNGGVTSKLY